MTVAIIGIITTFALGALYAARERARYTRTQATIAKLDRQIAYRWDSYLTRRLPIDPTAGVNLTLEAAPADVAAATDEEEIHELIRGTAAGIVAQRVVRARNELMRMELPDQYSDLFFVPQYLVARDTNGVPTDPIYAATRDTYLRRIAAAVGVDVANLDFTTHIQPLRQNESAEMLYLIVTTAAGGDSAPAARFKEREVGDTDGDGMPEFLDGWGRPIAFLRWAPGFRTDPDPAWSGVTVVSDYQTGEEHHDPNPFDPLHLDEAWNGTDYDTPPEDPNPPDHEYMGYRLYPLIMSAGPDGEFGIFQFTNTVLAPSGTVPDAEIDAQYAKNSFPYALHRYPDDDDDDYSGIDATALFQRGTPRRVRRPASTSPPYEYDPTYQHLDNVHNHALGAR